VIAAAELADDPATDLETDVLARALRDLSFARKARGALDAYGFTSKARQWVWLTLVTCIDAEGELPSGAVWNARLFTIANEDVRKAAKRCVLNLIGHKPVAPKAALAQIRDFVKIQAIERGLMDTASAADKLSLDEAEGALQKTLAAMRKTAGLHEEESVDARVDDRLARYMKTGAGRKYPTPLPALNRLTRGGPGPGRLCLITAYTGVGKSALSVDIGFTAAKEVPNLVVADITTEETALERQARYDARMSGIDREDLTADEGLSPGQAVAFRARYARSKHIAKRIHVKEIPPSSPVSDVEAFARELREKNPGVPLLINLDSGEHIMPTTRAESRRTGAAEVYRALKALAVAEEMQPCLVWVTDQLGRQTAKKKSVGTEDIAESLDKARLSDLFIAIVDGSGRVDPDDPWRSMNVLLRKSRLGKIKRWTITATAHLGTCEWRETGDFEEESPALEEGEE